MSRRHFFLDENLSDISRHLARDLFRQHKFDSAERLHMRGVLDVPLIEHLGRLGVDCIITQDKEQLSRPDERDALHKAGLHWIGVPEGPSGVAGIVSQGAVIAPAVQYVLSNWAAVPTAYHATPASAEPILRSESI